MKKLLSIFALLLTMQLSTQAQTGTSLNPKDWWNNMKAAAKHKKDSIIAARKAAVTGTTPTTATTTTPATTTTTPATTTTAANTTSTPKSGGILNFLNPAQNGINNTGTANNNSTDAVSFQIDGCAGNSAAQTVTVFFTISNPASVNQAIAVGGPGARVIDPDGNLCRPKEIRLADGNGGWQELPTGLKMKGSIMFSNILPKQTQLALMEFAVYSHNADGGRDPKTKNISVRNLNITWQ